MKRKTLNVQLPRGWYEVEASQPREYRRRGKDVGVLQLSLQPPPETELPDAEAVTAYLDELLAGLGMPLGSPVASGCEEHAEGFMAYAVFKHVRHGLLQFWLIPTCVTVFASWQMGGLATAGLERSEAHEIMRQVRFENSALD